MPAFAISAATTTNHSATSVARRRRPGSDTSLPIITHGPAGGFGPRFPRIPHVLSASSWLSKAGASLDRAAFRPHTLPNDLVTGIALVPPVVAGLLIFKLPALQMLAIALASGAVGILVARWVWRHDQVRMGASPLIAAVVGVALVGAGAGLAISAWIAALAVVLEVARARFMPVIRAQAGLIAYAVVTLATRGAPAAYINPVNGAPFGDPIATWYQFFSPAAAPIDSVRLYVGNVPGPVFATSMLAVAIGIAWLAYARRVSLVVLIGFLAGALLAVNTLRWDVVFQLDSGPTWFVAGLILADRRLLPESWAVRPALGFAAGLFAIGLRRPPQGAWLSGHGLEVAFFTVALIQAVMAVVVVVVWSTSIAIERWKRTRRLRQREANLRVVKTASRAS